jgi:hypothetical protein
MLYSHIVLNYYGSQKWQHMCIYKQVIYLACLLKQLDVFLHYSDDETRVVPRGKFISSLVSYFA